MAPTDDFDFVNLPPEEKKEAIQAFKRIIGPMQGTLDQMAQGILVALALKESGGEYDPKAAVSAAMKAALISDKIFDIFEADNTSHLEALLALCVTLKSGIDLLIGVASDQIKKSGMDWNA